MTKNKSEDSEGSMTWNKNKRNNSAYYTAFANNRTHGGSGYDNVDIGQNLCLECDGKERQSTHHSSVSGNMRQYRCKTRQYRSRDGVSLAYLWPCFGLDEKVGYT